MLRERTNIFERDKTNWESWVESLLWRNVVYRKNEYSGYDLIVSNPCTDRGYKVGDIVGDISILSFFIGYVKKLTWKELTLALGFFKNTLTPDGHDCEICEDKEKCHAYFKYDKDQERCSGWMVKHETLDDEKEYKKFIDGMMDVSTPKEIHLTQEQVAELFKQLNINVDESKI